MNRRSVARALGGMAAVVTMLGFADGAAVADQLIGASANLQQASGTIAAIDVQRGALKLQVSVTGHQPDASVARPTTFLVDEKTNISKRLKRAELRELKVGDQVTIDYAPQEGKNVARAISVEGSAAESSSSPSSSGL